MEKFELEDFTYKKAEAILEEAYKTIEKGIERKNIQLKIKTELVYD